MFQPVDLNPDAADLPLSCDGVPITYLSVNDFLNLAVELRKNIIVSGSTGTGKTTTTNALLLEISPDERLITIEDAEELVGALDQLAPTPEPESVLQEGATR